LLSDHAVKLSNQIERGGADVTCYFRQWHVRALCADVPAECPFHLALELFGRGGRSAARGRGLVNSASRIASIFAVVAPFFAPVQAIIAAFLAPFQPVFPPLFAALHPGGLSLGL
jgi:hypothetical protein